MDHADRARQAQPGPSLNLTAWLATLHCLTGCAIGEVLGMAFLFGYVLTLRPLLAPMGFAMAARLAFASDTASITVMEIGKGHAVVHAHHLQH